MCASGDASTENYDDEFTISCSWDLRWPPKRDNRQPSPRYNYRAARAGPRAMVGGLSETGLLASRVSVERWRPLGVFVFIHIL